MPQFPSVIAKLISEYAASTEIRSDFGPEVKLWIEKNLSMLGLMRNPNAMHIIEDVSLDLLTPKIHWGYLCQNPSAVHLIEREIKNKPSIDPITNPLGFNNVVWGCLSGNPAAIDLIDADIRNIAVKTSVHWSSLCGNSAAMYLIEGALANPGLLQILISPRYKPQDTTYRNPPKATDPRPKYIPSMISRLSWDAFSGNSSPEAIDIIEKVLQYDHKKQKHEQIFVKNPYINWRGICRNPAAIHIIEAALLNPATSYLVNWGTLSGNPAAIHLIEVALRNPPTLSPNQIDWGELSANPAAMHLIAKAILNPLEVHLVNKIALSTNPSIFWDTSPQIHLKLLSVEW